MPRKNIRTTLIELFGSENQKYNTENGEWSYNTYRNGHRFLDLRFIIDDIVILCETKRRPNLLNEEAEQQIEDYTWSEKQDFRATKILSILISDADHLKIWKNGQFLADEVSLDLLEHYISLFSDQSRTNNKEVLMSNACKLNEILHGFGIDEDMRAQFVGSIMISLTCRNPINYSDSSTTRQILAGISEIIDRRLDGNDNKSKKLDILNSVLQSPSVRDMDKDNLFKILSFIKTKIVPFVNPITSDGQDLLNLFFVTFNKYAKRKDKNQAFTPAHIVRWMCKLAKVSKRSKILDPTCGSGSFLVQGICQALRDCNTDSEKKNVLKNNIRGIESDETIFGLATTNMLIHEDGKSNIILGDCFKHKNWISTSGTDVVLMNPPFNANFNKSYLKNILEDDYNYTPDMQRNNKKSEDPTKGFAFVNWVCEQVGHGVCLCILPTPCAIGNSDILKLAKKKLLQKNRLEAVYSLPNQVFYPGATVNVCVMQIRIGEAHTSRDKTFFGYFRDDGFLLKKHVGRVDCFDKWDGIEQKWIQLFENKVVEKGLSVIKHVNENDEWLAEAYMETDYEKLSQDNFEDTINSYLSYLVQRGK